MSLVASWNAIYTASSPSSRGFVFPAAIPVGRTVIVAVGRGGAATAVTSVTDTRGNTWAIPVTGQQASGTLNIGLIHARVTTAIQAGDTLTIVANSGSNRWAVAVGVFDDPILPLNYTASAIQSYGTQQFPVAGPTADLVEPRALVAMAVGSTGGGFPVSNNVNMVADQAVTAVGSADRGVALLYKYEGGYAHYSAASLASGVISVSAVAAYETPDLPAGTIPVLTDTGEVPGVLSWWDGATETPVVSFEVSP